MGLSRWRLNNTVLWHVTPCAALRFTLRSAREDS